MNSSDQRISGGWTAALIVQQLPAAKEFALVLEARGIPHRLEQQARYWHVYVPDAELVAARAEVHAYAQENSVPRGGEQPIDAIGLGWPGVLAYVAVLLVFAVFSTRQTLAIDWFSAGSANAGAIVDGAVWRTLTALTLHSDLVHLTGNIIFGSFFGFYVGKYLGDGLGWALIAFAGAFGNLLNAIVQSDAHRSIGASTAVFAALGLLAAYRWRRGFARHTPWRIRFAPIFAAIALLAYTGTAGENTDLGAHLFGFLAGLGGGFVAADLARRTSAVVQLSIGVAALGCVVAAWLLAALVPS